MCIFALMCKNVFFYAFACFHVRGLCKQSNSILTSPPSDCQLQAYKPINFIFHLQSIRDNTFWLGGYKIYGKISVRWSNFSTELFRLSHVFMWEGCANQARSEFPTSKIPSQYFMQGMWYICTTLQISLLDCVELGKVPTSNIPSEFFMHAWRRLIPARDSASQMHNCAAFQLGWRLIYWNFYKHVLESLESLSSTV